MTFIVKLSQGVSILLDKDILTCIQDNFHVFLRTWKVRGLSTVYSQRLVTKPKKPLTMNFQ